MGAAYEAITTRIAWKAAAAVAKYNGVSVDSAGKFAKATSAAGFAGIVEYGADAADDMVTVVQGVFPGIAAANIAAGARVMPDATAAGQFTTAAATDDAVGYALDAITKDTIGSILMIGSPATE